MPQTAIPTRLRSLALAKPCFRRLGQREVQARQKGEKCTRCEVPEKPTAANDNNL